MIKFKDCSIKYDKLNNPTLKDLNFEIKDGEKILIVGISGSGKSTLGKTLNGLLPNSFGGNIDGEAYVNDLKLGKSTIFQISNHIGTILQDQDAQFVGLSTAEDIAFYLENTNVEKEEMHKQVDEVIKTLNIENLKYKTPTKLSGGQKQKVSIAGVLVNNVHTLLLDEPLANLDPLSAMQMMKLVDDLNKKYNKTIIMIEHRLEDALLINFDKIMIVNNGQIEMFDTPTNVLKSDILKTIGIRKPLYIEALEKINYDFSNIKDITNYEEFNISEKDLKNDIQCTKYEISDKKALELNNIEFSYNKDEPLLKGVSFDVKKGEILALLGNNGSGKSTLCNTILGLNKKYKGTIKLEDECIDKMNVFKRSCNIAYVMQNPNHFVTETLVIDELLISMKLQNLEVNEEEVDRILELCRLKKYKNWPINMLSYGQKRRVVIASILLRKPKVIILDEPTAGQDYNTFKSIMLLLRQLTKELNVGIIVITHNMQLAYEYCDRAVVLNDGRIKFDGMLDNLLQEKELMEQSYLRETSIQTFAKNKNIDAKEFGKLLFMEDKVND